MHRSLRLSALLFAANDVITVADETCLEEESSLLQEANKPVKTIRRDSKPLAGLLESAKGFLKNGVTNDVITFADATLAELRDTIIPTLANESIADQAWINTEHARFQSAIEDLTASNIAVHQWNVEEGAASVSHQACRADEKLKCDAKRDCEKDMYALWRAWVVKETELREIHTHIENHFCEQDEHGNFIANGTLHTFRVASVPWMTAYTEKKGECDAAEEAYDYHVKGADNVERCEEAHRLLDEESASCNADLDDLEGKACAHVEAITSTLNSFHSAWSSLHASFQGITDLVYNQTQDRHLEYKTIVIVECLLERVHELNGRPCDETSGSVDDQMTTCEQQGDESVICNEQPALCPNYPPPPLTPSNCADRHSVVGACLPVPQPRPCGDAWDIAEMDLPALPQPPFFCEEESCNPGCNDYPDCSPCSEDGGVGQTDYQTWVVPPASFALSHATFSAEAEDYADRNSLWGATVDGCSSDNSNSRDYMGDQSGQAIPLVVHSADEHAAVRCCSHDGNTCVSQVQAACHDTATFHDAGAICHSAGMRLCTQAEMGSGVCCSTGCWFNHYPVWIADGTGGSDLVQSDGSGGHAAGSFREQQLD
jgi:hypothetical protein